MLGFKAEKAGKLSHWASGLSLKMKAPFWQNYTNFLVSKTKEICYGNSVQVDFPELFLPCNFLNHFFLTIFILDAKYPGLGLPY